MPSKYTSGSAFGHTTTGFSVNSQIPLDRRLIYDTLQDLSYQNNRDSLEIEARSFYEGMLVTVLENNSLYIWQEVPDSSREAEGVYAISDQGGYTYPSETPDTAGVSYAGRTFNFVKVQNSYVVNSDTELQRIKDIAPIGSLAIKTGSNIIHNVRERYQTDELPSIQEDVDKLKTINNTPNTDNSSSTPTTATHTFSNLITLYVLVNNPDGRVWSSIASMPTDADLIGLRNNQNDISQIIKILNDNTLSLQELGGSLQKEVKLLKDRLGTVGETTYTSHQINTLFQRKIISEVRDRFLLGTQSIDAGLNVSIPEVSNGRLDTEIPAQSNTSLTLDGGDATTKYILTYFETDRVFRLFRYRLSGASNINASVTEIENSSLDMKGTYGTSTRVYMSSVGTEVVGSDTYSKVLVTTNKQNLNTTSLLLIKDFNSILFEEDASDNAPTTPQGFIISPEATASILSTSSFAHEGNIYFATINNNDSKYRVWRFSALDGTIQKQIAEVEQAGGVGDNIEILITNVSDSNTANSQTTILSLAVAQGSTLQNVDISIEEGVVSGVVQEGSEVTINTGDVVNTELSGTRNIDLVLNTGRNIYLYYDGRVYQYEYADGDYSRGEGGTTFATAVGDRMFRNSFINVSSGLTRPDYVLVDVQNRYAVNNVHILPIRKGGVSGGNTTKLTYTGEDTRILGMIRNIFPNGSVIEILIGERVISTNLTVIEDPDESNNNILTFATAITTDDTDIAILQGGSNDLIVRLVTNNNYRYQLIVGNENTFYLRRSSIEGEASVVSLASDTEFNSRANDVGATPEQVQNFSKGLVEDVIGKTNILELTDRNTDPITTTAQPDTTSSSVYYTGGSLSLPEGNLEGAYIDFTLEFSIADFWNEYARRLGGIRSFNALVSAINHSSVPYFNESTLTPFISSANELYDIRIILLPNNSFKKSTLESYVDNNDNDSNFVDITSDVVKLKRYEVPFNKSVFYLRITNSTLLSSLGNDLSGRSFKIIALSSLKVPNGFDYSTIDNTDFRRLGVIEIPSSLIPVNFADNSVCLITPSQDTENTEENRELHKAIQKPKIPSSHTHDEYIPKTNPTHYLPVADTEQVVGGRSENLVTAKGLREAETKRNETYVSPKIHTLAEGTFLLEISSYARLQRTGVNADLPDASQVHTIPASGDRNELDLYPIIAFRPLTDLITGHDAFGHFPYSQFYGENTITTRGGDNTYFQPGTSGIYSLIVRYRGTDSISTTDKLDYNSPVYRNGMYNPNPNTPFGIGVNSYNYSDIYILSIQYNPRAISQDIWDNVLSDMAYDARNNPFGSHPTGRSRLKIDVSILSNYNYGLGNNDNNNILSMSSSLFSYFSVREYKMFIMNNYLNYGAFNSVDGQGTPNLLYDYNNTITTPIHEASGTSTNDLYIVKTFDIDHIIRNFDNEQNSTLTQSENPIRKSALLFTRYAEHYERSTANQYIQIPLSVRITYEQTD